MENTEVRRIESLEEKSVLSSDVVSSCSSSFSVFNREIEFQPAKKAFSFGVRNNNNSNSRGDFRIETLNPDSGRNRASGMNPFQSGKKLDGSHFVDDWLAPELSLGITFSKIGAGLENLGNTCFLNSVLQCLTYTEPLAAYLQSGKHRNSCHIAGFCALCAIQKHVSCALQSSGRSLVPKDLVLNLRCISRNFRNARQEDAHEYMVNLLESMHKCCLPSGVPSESPAAYQKSLVHKIFGGHLRSQVECQQCQYCSNKFDPFLDLSLEIAKADTLPVALRNFTAAELLDGGEKQYQCHRCKQKVRAKKRLTVHKAPYVLTIHLKRFHAHNPGQKVEKKVFFDRSLDMKPFVTGPYEGDLKYSLYGVLVHLGHSTHSGHYVCFVRTSSGHWYLLDDDDVRQVSENTVLNQKAYMLFYVLDRKSIASRKPIDVVQKENMKATIGSNITSLVFKQLSKELADSCLTVNKSVAADSTLSANQKDALNFVTPKEILHKEALNLQKVQECSARNADPGAEPSSSELPEDKSKEVPPNSDQGECLPPSAPSVNKQSDAANEANGTTGAKSDCNEASSNCNEPQTSHIEKVITSDSSEKINLVLNLGVDGTLENIPRPSSSVDSIDKMLSKADSGNSPYKPRCESSQGGVFPNEGAVGNSMGDQAGNSGKQAANKLVESTPLVIPKKHLKRKLPDCLPQRKLNKKLSKRRILNMHLGSKFFRASLGLWKKKKHKKSKHCTLQTLNLKQMLEGNYFLSEAGPSTSKLPMSVSLGSTNSRKKAKSHSKCPGNSLVDMADEGLEKKNDNNSEVAIDKQLKKISFSKSNENKQDSCVIDCTESSRKDDSVNGMMCILTRGLEETTVVHWDGIELPPTQIVESSIVENLQIGYVPDEWDEEYDRGKRKKVRLNKRQFGGPNPFQEIASKTTQFKKSEMERSSSGNRPFRI